MSTELLPGSIVSINALPSYAGQSFEFMALGTVAKFAGEEHQRDCSLGAGYMTLFPGPNYAGDAFEGSIQLQPYNYETYILTGFFGPGQEETGELTLGEGYTYERPRAISP